MGFKSTAKAEALIRDLQEKLDLRTAGSGSGRVNGSRKLRDSADWPAIILSRSANEAAGQPAIGLRIRGVDAVSKDIFGGSIVAAAPHVAEIAYELDASGKPRASALDLAKVMVEYARLGCRIQVKELANGTAVTLANMDAASAAEDIDWLQWPSKGV
jgi:hypothetical protein